VIYDESHNMANRKAGFYKAAKQVYSDAVFELTGSPQVNGVWDLWTQLNLIAPKQFGSFWRFLYEHVEVKRGKFGMELGGPKNPTHTREVLKPYLMRRTKKTSGLNLPPKQRSVLEAVHTPLQKRLYAQLSQEMVADLGNGGVIMTPSRMALLTRLRQVNITPALIGAEHSSGSFDALKGKLDELFAARQHVIIFVPFTEVIPYIIDDVKGLTKNIATLVGGMTSSGIEEVVDWFQNKPLQNKLMIASIRAGTSWTATAASNCIFLGYDYTPMWNGQCEDRLHRFGQSTMVNAHYIVCRGTVDEHILEILDQKTSWQNLILNPEKLVRPA
jgi:SNF2 family DNA or RNA helicase